MADYWYDCWYHVKTCGIVRLKNSRIINFDYEPTHYFELQKIFTQLPFSKDSHLIDYGCGKGRVLLMAALYGCPRVTGIDLNSDLCRIAESNIARLRTHKGINTDIQVMEQDAIQYKIDPSINCFFFFNPFHLKVFIYVLKNIQNSVLQSPRDIRLIFLKPQKSTIWQVEKMRFFTLQTIMENPRCLVYTYSPDAAVSASDNMKENAEETISLCGEGGKR